MGENPVGLDHLEAIDQIEPMCGNLGQAEPGIPRRRQARTGWIGEQQARQRVNRIPRHGVMILEDGQQRRRPNLERHRVEVGAGLNTALYPGQRLEQAEDFSWGGRIQLAAALVHGHFSFNDHVHALPRMIGIGDTRTRAEVPFYGVTGERTEGRRRRLTGQRDRLEQDEAFVGTERMRTGRHVSRPDQMAEMIPASSAWRIAMMRSAPLDESMIAATVSS